MSAVGYPRLTSASDSAILVEFGDGIAERVNRAVYRFRDAIASSVVNQHVIETIPAYRSLLVEYDYMKVLDAEMRGHLRELAEKSLDLDDDGELASIGQVMELPVIYGGEFGPDLADVADHCGLSEEDVVAIHSGGVYRVYFIGFAPGFPYLGGMDTRIACPRLTTPRVRIPAGSVGIAESQTGIYPNMSAGGWRIIGRSPTALFDASTDPPSLLAPGATVKFVPADSGDFPDSVVEPKA